MQGFLGQGKVDVSTWTHPPWSCSPPGAVSRQVVNPRYSSSKEGRPLIFCGHLEQMWYK